MPKILNDPIRAVSVGIRQSDLDFINETGIGSNPSQRFRSVLNQCKNAIGSIAGRENATLVYEENEDGEKLWSKNPPIPVGKGVNWKSVPQLARNAGFACQVVEDKDKGTIQVWVAPGQKLNDCEACRGRVRDAMRG